MNWRRQQFLEDCRDAQKPCECQNNSDLCNPCRAREVVGMAKTPSEAWAMVAHQKRAIAESEQHLSAIDEIR